MIEMWKDIRTVKYFIFSGMTSICFLIILSNGIESQIDIYTVIETLIIFLLQLQRFFKIVKLSLSDENMVEKRDIIFFIFAAILMMIYLVFSKSLTALYMSIYLVFFISYMIYFSKNIKVAMVLFVSSLIPFELLLSLNGLRIIGNILILTYEIFSFMKVRDLVLNRKVNYK